HGLIEIAAPNICGGIAGPARGLPNDWKTALLEAPLRERFREVRVENDCVAALEAERRWGALQGFDHCAYVTWSTGIGCGLCGVVGRALYNLTVALDLERISLGGSVFWHNREYLLPKLKAQLAGKLPALTDGCELVGAGLQDRVGDYAALALLV